MMRVSKKDGEITFTATLSNLSNQELISRRGYMVGSQKRLHTISDMLDLVKPFESQGFVSLCTPFNRGKAGIVSFQLEDQ